MLSSTQGSRTLLGTAGAILCTIYSTAHVSELKQCHPSQNLVFGILLSWLKSGKIPQTSLPTNTASTVLHHQPQSKGRLLQWFLTRKESPSPGDPLAASLGPLELSHLTPRDPSWKHSFLPALTEGSVSKTLCSWSGDWGIKQIQEWKLQTIIICCIWALPAAELTAAMWHSATGQWRKGIFLQKGFCCRQEVCFLN